MRVLLTTDTIGGVWTFTRELAAGLLEAGHAVMLVSFGRAPSGEQVSWADEMVSRHGSSFCYEASAVPLEWMQNNSDVLRAGSILLTKIAERFVPDVFHTNQFCFGCLTLEVPKLVTAHSDVLSWADACRPHGLEPSPWLDRYVRLVQDGLEGADAVTAPTSTMLNLLRTHFAMPARERVIANGRSVPEDAVEGQRRRQAVSAGRLWDEAKGLRTLLEIDACVPIFIAGEMQLEGGATELQAAKVQLLGMLTEQEIMALYQASSVYLATSLYEPFGLAPLEAALCGCAVVARDIDSLREVWGSAALYFRTAAELAAILRTLFTDGTRLAEARSAAWQRARLYTVQRMTAQYLEVYRELIDGVERTVCHAA